MEVQLNSEHYKRIEQKVIKINFSFRLEKQSNMFLIIVSYIHVFRNITAELSSFVNNKRI